MRRLKYILLTALYLFLISCQTLTSQSTDELLRHFGFSVHITASTDWQKLCKKDTAVISTTKPSQQFRLILIPFPENPHYVAKIKLPEKNSTIAAFCDENSNAQFDEHEIIAAASFQPLSEEASSVVLSPLSENEQTIRSLLALTQKKPPTNLQSIEPSSIAKAFTDKNSALGLWQPATFERQHLAGLYLPKVHTSNKAITVLVHGINSNPTIFSPITQHLNNNEQQVAHFFYASGYPLEHNGRELYTAIKQLELKYSTVNIIAHSMGGLISRNALNHCSIALSCTKVDTLITLSTPWLGHNAAATGVKYAPNVVPVWLDMAPHSDFLESLLLTPLPQKIKHTLVFGFRQKDMLGFQTNDGTVSLESMLAPLAQQQAYRIRGVNEDHTSILSNPTTHSFLP